MTQHYRWWQKGIIYQIYPRSFQDTNADGIGDLPGITRRLDYLQSLGIDALWLSPIYPSPMYDFGYDVADYCDIDPIFGTMDDFDTLLAAAHRRGLKVLLDLVPNHTSIEHAWFKESRASRDNPKRDWYFWRDPAPDGSPPNNWTSYFGGAAWTFDDATGQYYLHQFTPEQPELNYRHPAVLAAMQDVMRFWLNKGVDGFRVDVIHLMMKDEQLRDEPENPDWDGVHVHEKLLHIHTRDLPDVHPLIKQLRAVVDEYDDRVMIGEIYLPNENLMRYYGENFDECHLPFNFQLIQMDWDAQTVRRAVDAYDAALPPGSWGNWVLGNHDRHRTATRIGAAQARVANMLLLTLRGTPTTYYGEEIGMEDGHIPPEFVQDPPAVNNPAVAHIIGRDPERTPMQWDGSPNAGFSPAGVQPWLPVADNYRALNVAAQEADARSMLSLYRALAALRRREPALSVGDYRSLDVGNDAIFAYLRSAPGVDRFLIVLNFSAQSHTINLAPFAARADIAIAGDMRRHGQINPGKLTLSAHEGLVLRLMETQ